MKFSISFKYSNVTFKNKETKETIAYDTKASEGNTFTFDNVDEDVVIGMLKGIKDKKASQLFAYDDLRTNFINVMARNKCKELYDKLDKAEWKIEDITVSNITIKDVEFTKPTMNAREAITVESKLKQNVDFKELSHIKDSDDLHNLEKVVSKAIKDIDETGFMAKDEKMRKRLHNIRMNLITALPEKKLVRDKYATMESKKMKKLNITKEQFNRSRYFQRKYGRLEYVSESGKVFKTSKGKVLKFTESYEDEYDDESVGDGEWHVFDYGPDFPLVEQYMIMAPTGDTWPASSSGAICDYDGEYSYSTRQEMEDEAFALEVDGEEWTPTEIDQPYPREVQKAIRLVISRLEEEGITVDEP